METRLAGTRAGACRRSIRIAATAGLAAAGMLAAAGNAGAQGGAPLFVSNGGGCSDARGAAEALNPATPLCTIGRGIALAGPGGRVAVRGGTYPALTVSGGPRTATVTVYAHNGEAVSLPSILVNQNASWLRFEGLRLTGDPSRPAFRVAEGSSQHIALVGSDVRSPGADAVDIRWGSNDILIEGNAITNAGGGGNGVVQSSDSNRPGSPSNSDPDPPITNMVVRNNRFTAIGTDAIRPANFDTLLVEGNDITGVNEDGDHADAFQVVWGGDHLVFRNNYVHDNNSQGFFIKDGRVTDVTFQNNVFVNNRGPGAQFTAVDVIGLNVTNNTFWNNQAASVIWSDTRNVVLRNNIFDRLDGQSAPGDMSATMASTAQDHNIIAGGNGRWTKRGPHDLSGAPAFVNAGAHDYRLAPGSNGIDAGTGDGAPPVDKACRPRYDAPDVANRGTGSPPFVDIGALEHGPSSAPGDTAASGCGGGPPPAPPPAAVAPAACNCPQAKKRRARVRVLGAKLRHRRLVLTVRAPKACAIVVRGRAVWKRHGDKQRVRLKRQVRRAHANRKTTLRLRVPRKVRRAVHHHRKVKLKLKLTVRRCNGEKRVAKRIVRLRR